ncbi:hypothetical protein L2E82_26944 [Cichorium intybus]|uniref:Uncharacterized protein n=1 Tax=Cichorium intybus TaxID=13427 RepID=A0ACB9CRL4_CICIN|nr:hypothetical protein L2E82_26944 [Cichorium intybus]
MERYSHVMGNSNGNIHAYWEAIDSIFGLQGGFIWDWVDQGLLKKSIDGSKYRAYGRDFGDTPHDLNFCINGLVWPDRTPHPALHDINGNKRKLDSRRKSRSTDEETASVSNSSPVREAQLKKAATMGYNRLDDGLKDKRVGIGNGDGERESGGESDGGIGGTRKFVKALIHDSIGSVLKCSCCGWIHDLLWMDP